VAILVRVRTCRGFHPALECLIHGNSAPIPRGECPTKTALIEQINAVQARISTLYHLERQGMRVTDELARARGERAMLMADLRDHLEQHDC
jgi:hypothetical protein